MIEEVVRQELAPHRCQGVKIDGVTDEVIHVLAGMSVRGGAKTDDLPCGAVGFVVAPKVVNIPVVSSCEVQHIVVQEVHVPPRVGRTALVDVGHEP